MTMPEKIPPKFTERYDPFAGIDHDTAAMLAYVRIMGEKHPVRQKLANIFGEFQRTSPQLIDRLKTRGLYVEPVDDDMNCEDPQYYRLRIFTSATALALTCVESLAETMNVDSDAWRRRWLELPNRIDMPVELSAETRLTSELCRAIGDTMIAKGQRVYDSMEEPYRTVYDSVFERFPEVHAEPGLFQGSFGFVYGAGRAVVESMTYQERINMAVRHIFPSDQGFDNAVKQVGRWDRKIARAALRSHRS